MTERKPWTRDEEARLRTGIALNETFSEIAEALGRTRNSCIGKADREGLLGGRCRSTQNLRAWNREQAKRAA